LRPFILADNAVIYDYRLGNCDDRLAEIFGINEDSMSGLRKNA
jgi:hypothetical protein